MSETTLLSISSLFSSAVGFLGTLALLIVALTLVRKANERAGWLLAAGFGALLVVTIAWPIASLVIPHLGVDFAVGHSAVSVLLTLVRAASVVLEVLGLVVLAQASLRSAA